MSEPTYQTAPITCPNCNNRFVAPVLTIIDVGQNPELKSLFLSGQANIAVCPQCGHAGMLSTPLVYHDPEKELLYTFVPPQANMPEPEQQRVIGDLTNQVISRLPAEQRKGYLLQPRSFLRLEGMVEAILEAEGITPEMMAAQRAKAALLERLLRATSEEARKTIAQENDDQIDYEFFQLLTLNLEMAETGGQPEAAQQLRALRAQLLEWTTEGQDVAAREEAIRSLGREITREGLLEKLAEAALASEDAKVETMIAVGRPAIDYVFYQQLTNQIESAELAGDTEKADTLRELRRTILDVTAQIDAELEQATQEAAQNLQELLDSDDPEAAIRADPSQLDDFFMSVLATSLQAAEQAGQSERLEKLRQINRVILEMIQESQPPEIRLINQLLSSDYPEETQVLLEQESAQVDAQLLEVMQLLVEDLAKRGQEELSQRLASIRSQAEAMVEG